MDRAVSCEFLVLFETNLRGHGCFTKMSGVLLVDGVRE